MFNRRKKKETPLKKLNEKKFWLIIVIFALLAIISYIGSKTVNINMLTSIPFLEYSLLEMLSLLFLSISGFTLTILNIIKLSPESVNDTI